MGRETSQNIPDRGRDMSQPCQECGRTEKHNIHDPAEGTHPFMSPSEPKPQGVSNLSGIHTGLLRAEASAPEPDATCPRCGWYLEHKDGTYVSGVASKPGEPPLEEAARKIAKAMMQLTPEELAVQKILKILRQTIGEGVTKPGEPG